MARRQRMFEMTSAEPIHGIRMSTVALSDEEVLRRVRETVEGWQRISDLTPFLMRPSWGYLSLGMRDVRASPPPVPEDAKLRAENRALAKAYKERKDVEEARRKRKSLERDELEKRHRQQRRDGLLEEESLSSSSMEFLSDDDESEALKAGTSSTARWVVEAQAALQHGAVSARADPREPAAQGEATDVATDQAREEAPTPREVGPLESGGAEAPLAAKATEGEAEAPRNSRAEVAEVEASRASEAEVADAGAPGTTEAEVVEVGAPGTTRATVAEAVALGATEAKVAEAVALGATEAEAAEAGVGVVEPVA
ncbi:uncharacterized protein [Miscanthus floridulus]|uniref:uncharacterized protein n=1 Tax=Miscanthus floridulus TaxID=154761 RepID=UPI0034599F33